MTSFFGTLNLQTGVVTTTQADTLHAETTIAHLEAVLAAYSDQLILLWWDRAPWHTAQRVQQFLQQQWRIAVICLPVGAPDRNPQEHVWKAVCHTMHHNHDHATLATLAAAFSPDGVFCASEKAFAWEGQITASTQSGKAVFGPALCDQRGYGFYGDGRMTIHSPVQQQCDVYWTGNLEYLASSGVCTTSRKGDSAVTAGPGQAFHTTRSSASRAACPSIKKTVIR
ncbi:hypothetical protein HC891_12330 [Candidatus Gracilibacteria bacterium]|nr:hypothetical protein [Candidatus Gracilibacteria bacterium]